MTDTPNHQDSVSPRISIIVVSYNCVSYLQSLLASIAIYSPRDSFELLVVDNASADETVQWCRDAPLNIRLIINNENRGFAAAANAGARVAQGEFLLFCNPDVRWTSPVVDRLVKFMEDHPRCGAAAARMTSPDNRFQPTCRRFPTHANIWFSRGSLFSRLTHHPRGRCEYTLPDFARPTRVDAAAATCLMMRRQVFEDLGGFDERFFLFVEDTDLCRRLADTGYETWFVPSATAIHHWGGSSADRQAVVRHHAESIVEYFRKHYPQARVRNLLLSLAVRLAGGRVSARPHSTKGQSCGP